MNLTETNIRAVPHPKADPVKPVTLQGEAIQEPRKPDSPAADHRGVAIEQTNPVISLSVLDVTLSFVALFSWIALIAAGVAINSKHYIDNLAAPTQHGFWVVAGSGLVVATCHVVPNIALLSCLAAYLGVLAARTFPGEADRPPSREGHRATLTMAITRGIYVYLILLSGSVLFSSEGFGQWPAHMPASAADAAGYETYTRLASLCSLLSFTAGYNPELFRFLLARVSQFETNPQRPARPAGEGHTGNAGGTTSEKSHK